MRIYLGADHAAYALKEEVRKKSKFIFNDLTPHLVEADDYPLIAERIGRAVAKNNAKGVLMCKSGIGVCVAANKIKGIRAAVCRSQKEAKMGREDDDINVLCIGSEFTTQSQAQEIISSFLSTKFLGNSISGQRHKRRRNEIIALESL